MFFWAMDTQVNSTVKDILYLAILVSQWLCGLATVTSRIAHDLRLLAGWRSSGIQGSGQGQPDLSHPGCRNLDRLDPCRSVSSGARRWSRSARRRVYTIVVSCTVIFLFFSFAIPITLGLFAWGTSKWDKMGPWNLGEGVFKLFAVLTILAMILIFVLGVQPPNTPALYVTVGFLVLTGIVWFGFERRRFKGPPIGDEVARRSAEIAAAEKAVGQK